MAIPNHIGIILDGNRRFSKKLMLKPYKGHEYGAEKIKKLYDWAKELGIKELTLYAFSIENFNRPKLEFNYLMKLFEKEIKALKEDPRIFRDKIKVNFIGRTHLFPAPIPSLMKDVMNLTKHHNGTIFNFAMAYGGRAEIIDTTKKIAKQISEGKIDVGEINENLFSENLYLNSSCDLIIRTSGEKRTSGFLPWQGVYSELYFCDKFWPEFEKEDFIAAINEFQSRERRFGR